MGYLGATLAQVFARTRGRSEHVTHRCHNSPDGKQSYVVWVTSRTRRARRILGDFEKVSWDETCHGGRRLAFVYPRREALGWCRTRWGADEKARIERLCLSLSLCRRTFKLKGNKKVSYLNKEVVFFVFRYPMFYVIYIYEHYMSIAHIHIELWYNIINPLYFYQFNLVYINNVKRIYVLLSIGKKWLKPLSFVYIQLNHQTVLFLTILFSKC